MMNAGLDFATSSTLVVYGPGRRWLDEWAASASLRKICTSSAMTTRSTLSVSGFDDAHVLIRDAKKKMVALA